LHIFGQYPDVAINGIFVVLNSIARLIGDSNHASQVVLVVIVVFLARTGDIAAAKAPVDGEDVGIVPWGLIF